MIFYCQFSTGATATFDLDRLSRSVTHSHIIIFFLLLLPKISSSFPILPIRVGAMLCQPLFLNARNVNKTFKHAVPYEPKTIHSRMCFHGFRNPSFFLLLSSSPFYSILKPIDPVTRTTYKSTVSILMLDLRVLY